MRGRGLDGHFLVSILVFSLTRLTVAIVAAPILVLFLAFILVNLFLDLYGDEPMTTKGSPV